MPTLLDHWPRESDWTPRLAPYFASPQWSALEQFVAAQRQTNRVCPSAQDVFRAFATPGYAKTKVVILGQDPYHGEGQAHGLSFSVENGVKPPPSLKNIFLELHTDTQLPIPSCGNLEPWAQQGVFLLNTVLTVNQGQAFSHRRHGWEDFTDFVIRELNQHPEPVVFVLWGNPAKAKAALIDDRHEIIRSPHPSPLSARRGFFGSRPFSKTNEALKQRGRTPIDWALASTDRLLSFD